MKVKNIVVISNLPLSEPVSRNRILPILDLLIAEKIKVTLICPKGNAGDYSFPSAVHLIEVPLKVIKPKSFIKRALKEARDVAILLKTAKKEQAHAYLVTIPSMFLAFLSPIHLRKETVLLDIRDLTWEYLSEESLVHSTSKKLFRLLFRLTINFYQLVSVTNTTELAYVEKVWKGNKAPLLVSNGISLRQFNKLEEVSASASDKLIVTYIGNIGIAQHLSTLIDAAKELPEVLFKIVGTGIEHEKIEKIILTYGISNVELTGLVSWDSVKHYYDSTDVLYAQLTPDFSGAMPSKLYEYLSTGKYIIYGGQGQATRQLQEFRNNEIIEPCDVEALVKAIKKAALKEDISTISIENREKIKQQFIRENTAKKLIDAIKKELNSY